MIVSCKHDGVVWRDKDTGDIFHMGPLGPTRDACDDEDAKRRLEPIANMENFIHARQKRGKTPVEIRDALMERGYDIHAAGGLVGMFWSEVIAQELAAS